MRNKRFLPQQLTKFEKRKEIILELKNTNRLNLHNLEIHNLLLKKLDPGLWLRNYYRGI
jgi:hypothetical protein